VTSAPMPVASNASAPAEAAHLSGASLENGLLQVDLLRMVPEAMKPRAIPITTAKKVVLEGKAAKIAAQQSDD
jgi:molecular chaperone IbpA